MQGSMQERPLALPHVFHRAERHFGHKTIAIATDRVDTTTHYRDWALRVRRLATVLDALHVRPDARVGTFAWNTRQHLEPLAARWE